MYKTITYNNSKLEDLIRKKHIIPYTLTRNDRYEKGKYYFDGFSGKIFKVLFVKYYKTGELEGAEIRYEDNMHAYMCTEIDPGYDFRTEMDFNEIYKKINIINDGNIYTGAEIKYWFFVRNINCFNRKYKDFWYLVDTYSMDQIADNKNYIITGDINHVGKYHNCKITEVITTGV